MSSGGEGDYVLAAWKPPLIVAASAFAIVGGFYVGGPGLGLAVGALAASAIVVMAARAVPRGPIVPAPLPDLRRRVLVVVSDPLEDSETISQIARICEAADPELPSAELRLLAPTSTAFLDRWSGDRAAARILAQRRCVLSLASLAKAGLRASAGVGDEDPLLAIEDELRTFPATDVVLVAPPGAAEAEEPLAAELRERLRADFLHLTRPEAVAAGDRASVER
ncbi:MAG: hypothetical protein JST31_04175 [Actinobacteria bacterium]|nr:hypothetical protein [Actinomycetota bacterium]